MRTHATSLALLLSLVTACGGGAKPPASSADAPASSKAEAPPTRADERTEASTGPASTDAPAGTYRIVLDRAARVGEKTRVTTQATESHHEQYVVDGKVTKEEDHRVQVTLVADQDVLEVTPQGKWSKARLTLISFAAAGQQGDETILPPGTVLTIERAQANGEATITSSRGGLTNDQRKALKLAFPSGPIRADSTDDTFGTKVPQAPGASWDISREAAAASLTQNGAITSPELVMGRTTLVAVKDDRGTPCLEIAARLHAKVTGSTKLPKNVKIEGGVVIAEALTLLPVDPTKGPHRVRSRTETEMVATIDGGARPTTLRFETLSVTETTYEER